MPIVFSGAQLRAQLEAREWRTEELATLTGYSYRYLDNVVRGHARPSTRTVEVLADALGCEPGDLFADDGQSRGLLPPGPKPPPLSEATREQLRRLLDLRGDRGAA